MTQAVNLSSQPKTGTGSSLGSTGYKTQNIPFRDKLSFYYSTTDQFNANEDFDKIEKVAADNLDVNQYAEVIAEFTAKNQDQFKNIYPDPAISAAMYKKYLDGVKQSLKPKIQEVMTLSEELKSVQTSVPRIMESGGTEGSIRFFKGSTPRLNADGQFVGTMRWFYEKKFEIR